MGWVGEEAAEGAMRAGQDEIAPEWVAASGQDAGREHEKRPGEAGGAGADEAGSSAAKRAAARRNAVTARRLMKCPVGGRARSTWRRTLMPVPQCGQRVRD